MTTCPKCGHAFTTKKLEYSQDFLAFWLNYEAVKRTPTASKSDAMKAWTQIEGSRPSQARLLVAVRGYLAQIDKENIPACHPATWLRQGRYENFLPQEVEQHPEEATKPTYTGWPTDIAQSIMKDIGEPKFKVWLGDASFKAGTPTDCATIVVNTDLKRNYIETKLASVLSAKIGHFEVIVK